MNELWTTYGPLDYHPILLIKFLTIYDRWDDRASALNSSGVSTTWREKICRFFHPAQDSKNMFVVILIGFLIANLVSLSLHRRLQESSRWLKASQSPKQEGTNQQASVSFVFFCHYKTLELSLAKILLEAANKWNRPTIYQWQDVHQEFDIYLEGCPLKHSFSSKNLLWPS